MTALLIQTKARQIDTIAEWYANALSELRKVQAENAALRRIAADLRNGVECVTLHHRKGDQHAAGEPCKVLARFDAALGAGEWV